MTVTSVAHRSPQRAQPEVVPLDAALGAEVRGLDLSSWMMRCSKRYTSRGSTTLYWCSAANRSLRRISSTSSGASARRSTSSNLHQRSLEERAANQLYNLPPEVTVVSNVQDQGKSIGILGDGEVVWHSDFSFKERPTAARMLVAMEIPPQERGGNTFFLNCYAAYDALPEKLKKRVSGMTVKQANIIDTAMKLRPGRFTGRGRSNDARPQPPDHLHASRDRMQLAVPRQKTRRLRQWLLAGGIRGVAERIVVARHAIPVLLRTPVVRGRCGDLGQSRNGAPPRSLRSGEPPDSLCSPSGRTPAV